MTILDTDHINALQTAEGPAFETLIGTMDLKIAAIALAQDSLVLSANLRDFKRVPDLRVADWMH